MVLLFFSRSLTGRAVMELMVVILLQGNLDPALNRHASLPAAQLAALCEVAASCLEPQPTDRSAPAQDACPASHADHIKLHQESYLSGDSALLQISGSRWSFHQFLLLQLASSILPSCKIQSLVSTLNSNVALIIQAACQHSRFVAGPLQLVWSPICRSCSSPQTPPTHLSAIMDGPSPSPLQGPPAPPTTPLPQTHHVTTTSSPPLAVPHPAVPSSSNHSTGNRHISSTDTAQHSLCLPWASLLALTGLLTQLPQPKQEHFLVGMICAAAQGMAMNWAFLGHLGV